MQYAPLQQMLLADLPANTNGALFGTQLWWNSSSPNTIEGCVRACSPRTAACAAGSYTQTMLLSTGWEDYYASSWGMVAGPFTGSFSGTTHWTSPGNRQVSHGCGVH